MYIKLSFQWKLRWVNEFTGLVEMRLQHSPVLEDVCSLPEGVGANKSVNLGKEKEWFKFDYYFNCGAANVATVKKALHLFNVHYQGDYLAVGDRNPDDNELTRNFAKALLIAAANSNTVFSLPGNIEFSNEKVEWKATLRNLDKNLKRLECRL
jgi:hypothetical protein